MKTSDQKIYEANLKQSRRSSAATDGRKLMMSVGFPDGGGCRLLPHSAVREPPVGDVGSQVGINPWYGLMVDLQTCEFTKGGA
jgi:hypothetical protein